MHYLSRNPRRVLVGLLTVVVAAAAAVGSGADFSSHSANPAASAQLEATDWEYG